MPTIQLTLFFYYGLYPYHFYPHGPLDTVGYWAETQIFGGVLSLEHDQSETRDCHLAVKRRGIEDIHTSAVVYPFPIVRVSGSATRTLMRNKPTTRHNQATTQLPTPF